MNNKSHLSEMKAMCIMFLVHFDSCSLKYTDKVYRSKSLKRAIVTGLCLHALLAPDHTQPIKLLLNPSNDPSIELKCAQV